MEIIEHNLVEEELGSQHPQEKNMKGARKMKGNGNRCRGSLASPVSGKLLR